MSSHTPGPWVVDGKFVLAGRRLLAAAQAPRQYPDPMDEMQGDESWLDAYARLKPARDAILAEQHSNARLIASAPELLGAAKEALVALDAVTFHLTTCVDASAKLRAAIAKAEGQP